MSQRKQNQRAAVNVIKGPGAKPEAVAAPVQAPVVKAKEVTGNNFAWAVKEMEKGKDVYESSWTPDVSIHVEMKGNEIDWDSAYVYVKRQFKTTLWAPVISELNSNDWGAL